MATTPTAGDRRYLAQLARAYYLDNKSKVEIGKTFGLSRFQVARYLQDAVDTGVVTITIESDAPDDELAGQLAEALGLQAAIVVDADTGSGGKSTPGTTPGPGDRAGAAGEQTASATAAQMGRAALEYVGQQARPGMRIGLAWSRTLDAAAEFTPALPRCTVVQLAGTLQLDPERGTGEIFTRLGQERAVSVVRLYAPLLVSAADTAADLKALTEITSALGAADRLDLAVVSVAAWAPGESSVWEKCTPEQRTASRAAGAVAEVSGRLMSETGADVGTIDDRVIAVSLDQLREAGTTVGVARGAQRAGAMRAACAAGILDVAIVDAALARAVVGGDAVGD